MSRTSAEPSYTRLAFFPGLLGAIILLAGLALIGNDWYLGVRYGVSVLALIMCVFAFQAKQFWWFAALIPLAVIWNPVWPITLPDLVVRLLSLAGSIVFVVVGIRIKVPSESH